MGGQGRLLAERALVALLGQPPRRLEENLSNRTDQLQQRGGETATVNVLHKLRKYGNHTDHDELPDLRPNERSPRW